MRPAMVAAALLLALGASCTGPAEHVAGPPHPRPSRARRSITRPRRAQVVFEAEGEPARRLRQAEHDLKRIGLWKRLSAHLYEVKVAVRPGRSDIPGDRHLADAYPSAVAAPGGYGSLCDIVFYPAAIAEDLGRWRRYHSEGLLGPPPDSLRQYWGSILAHELAHCLGNGRGERVALRWEHKSLARLRRAGAQSDQPGR